MVAVEHRSITEQSNRSTTVTATGITPSSSSSTVTTTVVVTSAAVSHQTTALFGNNLNVDFLSPTLSTDSSSSSATTSTTSSAQQQQQLERQGKYPNERNMSASIASGDESSSTNNNNNKQPSSVGNTGSVVSSAKSAISQRQVDIQICNETAPTTKSCTELTKQELTRRMLRLDLTGKELDEYSIKSPKSPIVARLPHQTSLTSSVDVEDRKTLRDALYQGIFHRHRRTIFAVGSFLRMLRSRNSQYNSIRSSSEGDTEDIDEVK